MAMWTWTTGGQTSELMSDSSSRLRWRRKRWCADGVRRAKLQVVAAVTGVMQITGCGDVPEPPAIVDPIPDAAAGTDAPAMDATPMMGPSCQGLPAICGPSGTDNCCNPGRMVVGGSYYRSHDIAGYGDLGAPATVSTFWLDKYEVTVGRFRAFVNARQGTQASPPAGGAGAHSNISNSGWNPHWNASLTANQAALVAAIKCDAGYQNWTDIASTVVNEARPMNCLTWYEAMAFCIWDGGYLPTEAEWNYAATGGSEQRAYPWSSPPASLALTDALASYRDGTNCVGDGMAGCGRTDLVPVGSKPMGDGRWGHSDLTGNVWEWILDWYVNSYMTPCTDCAWIGNGIAAVLRGGGFNDPVSLLRTGYRHFNTPTDRYANHGVRCARAPRN